MLQQLWILNPHKYLLLKIQNFQLLENELGEVNENISMHVRLNTVLKKNRIIVKKISEDIKNHGSMACGVINFNNMLKTAYIFIQHGYNEFSWNLCAYLWVACVSKNKKTLSRLGLNMTW